MQWTTPKEYLLWGFLQTWEATEDKRILGRVCGQEIFIDHVLIHENLGISKEGVVDATNATFEKARTIFKWFVGPHIFVENE
jgi:hypothetical protein